MRRRLRREAEGGDERWDIEDRHLGDVLSRCETIGGDDLYPASPIAARRFAGSIEGKRWLGVSSCRRETPLLLYLRAKLVRVAPQEWLYSRSPFSYGRARGKHA